MFKTWPNLAVDELVFHLTEPLSGANQDMIIEYIVQCIVPMLLALILFSVLLFFKRKTKYYVCFVITGIFFSMGAIVVSLYIAWEKAGIQLPGYDVEKISAKAKEAPVWVHFGIGNIFRVFIGGIADGLLEEGILDRGITCVETFDYDVVDKIYEPYDNLGLNVILHGDGTREYKVLGALAEAVKAQSSELEQWNRLKEIFTSKSLQMASFTITEKGYALHKADGTWFPFVQADIQNGPDKATGAMAVLVAMLYERYKAGKYPIALVSMDNCSQNGAKLRESVLTMTEEWKKAGFVDDGFISYVSDEKVVAFPWTMIDKITPRPSEQIAADLEKLGVESMQPVITSKKTYIAPFVNAEKPQYLVIEDSFPNGRPALEKGFGVYMADRLSLIHI